MAYESGASPTESLAALLWAIPALLAVLCARRHAPGARWGWWLVAAVAAVISLDEALGLQRWIYDAGRDLVGRLDPVHRLRGPHMHWRWVLLGSGPAVGVGLLLWLTRGRLRVAPPAALSLFGVVVTCSYAALRLVPTIKDRLTPELRPWIETCCWGVICVGIGWGLRGARVARAAAANGEE